MDLEDKIQHKIVASTCFKQLMLETFEIFITVNNKIEKCCNIIENVCRAFIKNKLFGDDSNVLVKKDRK